MINNRQAGRRNRGRNNNNNGRPSGNNRGGGDSGNRIDSRARGNATQLLEKYRNMARDAQMAGDRVNAEYYLQFADHYFRVLADNRARQEEQGQTQGQQPRFRRNDESLDYDGSDDFDGNDDSGNEPPRAEQQSYDRPQRDYNDRAPREQGQREQGQGDRAPRDYNDRAPREQNSRDQADRAPRDQNRRQDEPREGREDRGVRRDRPRRERPVQADRPVMSEDEARPQDEMIAPAPVVETPVAPQAEAEAPRPRRGRPRKVDAAPAAEASEGLDLSLLPPSIARADNDSETAEEAPKKRTRRARPATEAAE